MSEYLPFDPFDPFAQDFMDVDPRITMFNELAIDIKHRLEDILGYRLSLVVIDAENSKLNLFHLPSSNIRAIEYAKGVAKEVYEEYRCEIETIQNSKGEES